jgi:hypothetical protein
MWLKIDLKTVQYIIYMFYIAYVRNRSKRHVPSQSAIRPALLV